MPRGCLQFQDHLELEIIRMRDVITRKDGNPDFDNGLMAELRREKLFALESLLMRFYPRAALPQDGGHSDKA